jgi:carbon-monoxide dehydrogenase large subunit
VPHIGEARPRKEDDRFLTGRGQYVDDIRLPGETYAAFVRSPHAHARIGAISVDRARQMPGVLAVLTGEDWRRAGGGDTAVLWDITSFDGTPMTIAARPILTTDVARHVGDTVALVVAEDPDAAADAAAAVEVDWGPLPAITDTASAVNADVARVHAQFENNISYDWRIGDAAAVEAAMAAASHVTALTLGNNRLAPSAIEPRAVIGNFDQGTSRYTLWSTTQNPHLVRQWLSRDTLGAPEQDIRVVAPDVGGGFGQKTYHYPEEASVLWASRQVGRPVRWTATRSETLMVDIHARDHVSDCRIGFDGDGRIVALETDTIASLGAYQSQFGAAIPSMFYGGMLSGQYAIPAIHCRVRGVYTHTTPIDAYRGAGNPECTYVLERLFENAARELGLDVVELRARNVVPTAQMPYTSATGITYDVGDFPAVLAKTRALADFERLRAEQAQHRASGVLMGIGVAAFVRSGGAGPSRLAAQLGSRMGLWDVATVRVHPSGKITVLCGSHSHGQSHATTYAQIVADRFGCALEDVDIVEGDTDRIPHGLGTWASRSLTVVGGAISIASDRVIDKGRRLAAHLLECAEDDIDFGDGDYNVRGTDRRLSFPEIADMAYRGADYPDGFELGLEEVAVFDPDDFNYPYGTHAATVIIDRDTGHVRLTGYYLVEDAGLVVNPMVVAGQRHGAVAQGVGQALLEHVVYDPDGGQLVTGSFMDYTLPRADDLPTLLLDEHTTITQTNPLGVKGVGEVGTSGPPAAIGNAVVDALWHLGVRHVEMPFTAERVWRAIREAEAAT